MGLRGGTGDAKPEDIVVFWVRRDTVCAECGTELEHGSVIRIEQDGALCLACADLGHLVFLPRGDVALTRRATRHSKLCGPGVEPQPQAL
jgi:hypothetical protein